MKHGKLKLPEQNASELREAAEHFTVSHEQFSILSIEEKLAQLEDEFRRSAEYVLQKNAELYSRLSCGGTYLSLQESSTPTFNLTK